MGKVNWKIRFKSKTFLTSLIALVLVFANQVATLLGYNIEFISAEITNMSETVLMILILLGVINDPTVKDNGLLGDSEKVLNKDK